MRKKKTKMKEIKFRGKRVDNGEWVYGSLVIQKYNKINKYYIIDSGFISCEFAFFEEVNPETVGQFVGLKDSKGIEIYERDIVRFLDDMRYVVSKEKEYLVGEVRDIDGAFWCYYKDEENLTRLVSVMVDYWAEELKENQCEIIGNIKENPELIKDQ